MTHLLSSASESCESYSDDVWGELCLVERDSGLESKTTSSGPLELRGEAECEESENESSML